MIIESDGSVRYGTPKASRINTRGTKVMLCLWHLLTSSQFAIPKPKGGRSDAMILREDQREYQRPQRKVRFDARCRMFEL